jgi:transposase-like protein
MDRRSKEAERRKRILDHAKTNGNVAKTCRYFGVARASFYRWRQEYQKHGDPGLIPKRPLITTISRAAETRCGRRHFENAVPLIRRLA